MSIHTCGTDITCADPDCNRGIPHSHVTQYMREDGTCEWCNDRRDRDRLERWRNELQVDKNALQQENERLREALESLIAWAEMLPLRDGDKRIVARAQEALAASYEPRHEEDCALHTNPEKGICDCREGERGE